MTYTSLQVKNDSKYFRISTQADSLGDFTVNHALVQVAKEVARLLQDTYRVQLRSWNHQRSRRFAATNRSIISTET